MATPELWLQVLSLIKAIFDATKSGLDLAESYEKHRNEPETIQEAQRVSEVFSTYSENEVKAILNRLEQCRDRFIAEGSGDARARCLCNVLNDVKGGNGGVLPLVDDWQNIYNQLQCG